MSLKRLNVSWENHATNAAEMVLTPATLTNGFGVTGVAAQV